MKPHAYLASRIVCAAAVLGLAGPGMTTAQSAAPKSVPLKPVELKAAQLRAGSDLAGKTIPASGFQAKVGSQTLVFVDVNANGSLEAEEDGLSMPPSPFVVPLPQVLLLASGQFEVSFKELKAVRLTKQSLGAAETLVSDAAVVTELRMRAGARPIVLDSEVCAACEKHCEYLKLNKMNGGSGGLATHQEDPAKPGYSPEGEKAGRNGCLAFGEPSLRDAILDWYPTAWHGVPIVDPSTTRFGVAFKHGVSVFWASERGARLGRPIMHPADGARDIPPAFGERGEIPNPVPGTQYGIGCGFPILVMLADPNLELTAAVVKPPKGAAVKGTMSSRVHPANPEWPTNSDCALFIPSEPLAPNTKYSVRFEFKGADAMEWSFTTAAK